MFKTIMPNIKFFVLFFWLSQFYLNSSLSWGAIVHESKDDSPSPRAIMISLPELNRSLPDEFVMASDVPWMKILNDPIHPLRLEYSQMIKNMRLRGNLEGQQILALLVPSARYSYVLSSGYLVLAEINRSKKLKKFSKHFFIAGFSSSVKYAGEAWLSPNRQSLLIDNNSGSYKPKKRQIEKVAGLLSGYLGVEVISQHRRSSGK